MITGVAIGAAVLIAGLFIFLWLAEFLCK